MYSSESALHFRAMRSRLLESLMSVSNQIHPTVLVASLLGICSSGLPHWGLARSWLARLLGLARSANVLSELGF